MSDEYPLAGEVIDDSIEFSANGQPEAFRWTLQQVAGIVARQVRWLVYA
jgi:hypothetical protein